MSRTEAADQYARALKQGRRTYKDSIMRGQYPYPQVLDEILADSMIRGRVDLGVIEIPTEQIVGTKSAGRKNAFAADFMPLMDSGSEFASKWINLCDHLGEEGLRDPIQCFEYLGRFYVQEGNKRVSVMKSFAAPSIPAKVIRVIPTWSEDTEIQAYYDFLQSYQKTGLYQVAFSRPGCFAKLQTALGYEQDHVWTEEERRAFAARFSQFQKVFWKKKGDKLPVTTADALLTWLKVYPLSDLRTRSEAELGKSLDAVWSDITLLAQPDPISVSTETQEPTQEDRLWGRVLKTMFPTRLNVAFISNLAPEESDWSRAHDLGRQYLEAVMGDQVTVRTWYGVTPESRAVEAIDEAVASGAQVVFATTPTLIGACRKAAAKHPDVRILDCSASMPYAGVRTYYSRIYEGKFITGAIAGAVCRTGRIGYIASNPIFGVPAGINAFALGVQLTNPGAKVRLRWSCVEEDAMERLARDGAELISNRDLPTPDRMREPWGLCRAKPGGGFECIASPYWHWGNFYVKLVRSIMSGGWDALSASAPRAVNYWWGMKSRVVDVQLGPEIPAGVCQLADLLRRGISEESVLPFLRPIRSQDGAVRSDGSRWFSPEEILHMDWLCDSVEGSIPSYDELLPMARPIARLLGVYREQIPPEKEDPIL